MHDNTADKPNILSTSFSFPHIAVNGNDLNYIFEKGSLPEILIEIEEKNWNNILAAYDEYIFTNKYIPASFSFTKGTESHKLENIGIRLKGHISRLRPEGYPKQKHGAKHVWRRCSYMINFGKYIKGQTFLSLRKLGMKVVREDPTYVREMYCHDLYHRYKINTAQLCCFCRFSIHISGDEKPVYHGIYLLMEAIDKTYLNNRTHIFGDSKGFLWKAREGATLIDPSPAIMTAGEKNEETKYTLKTNKKRLPEAQEVLSDFIRNLNQLNGEKFVKWIKSAMNVEYFLKTYALNTICGNWDDYWANSNNYYLYFNRNHQFFMIPHDMENTLAKSGFLKIDYSVRNPLRWSDNKNPLVRKILLIPEFRNIYLNTLYELVDPEKDFFYVDHSIPRIIKWLNQIWDYVPNDTKQFQRICDRTASWGSHHHYRLVLRPNNFFIARAKSLPRSPSGNKNKTE